MRLNTSSSLNKKASQQRPQLGIGGSRSRIAQIVEHAPFRVQLLVLILREIIGHRVVSQRVIAGGQRLGPRQQLDQGGFARAVHAHQRDPVAALDNETRAAENVLRAVALRDVLELRHDPPARLRLREREMNRLLVRRNLDALDLLQFLDPRLHLLGLGRLSRGSG